jgi:demethylmenaquinone methyltransferase/2-methoxy-6-polyprenyl-1,4-benzoquinol methylase
VIHLISGRVMLDHFDLLSSVYDRLIGGPNVERLRRYLDLPTSGWLLDGGGGTGRVSWHLRPLVGKLVVSDLSHRMLIRARRKALWSVRAHAERLPFADNRFDRVLVVDALHHFCDQQQAVTDLVRVLRPGGTIVIEEFDLTRRTVKLMALAEKMALMRSRFYSPGAIRDMLEQCALTTWIEGDGGLNVWIVGRKTLR